jgi:hypothetical protein
LYKDKIPELPPPRLRRKSKEVIEERKKYLTRKLDKNLSEIIFNIEYMTKLSQRINIFGDDDIIKFLRLDREVGHLLSNLRDLYELNRLGV